MNVTFHFLVLEILKKYHKGDFAGHCSIYFFFWRGGGGRGRLIADEIISAIAPITSYCNEIINVCS